MKLIYKRMQLVLLAAGVLSMTGYAFAQQGSPPGPPRFRLKSPVVRNNGSALPVKYTCDGEGISLPLFWENPPDGTRSYAIIMMHIPPDDEAEHVYMVLYNIPADVNALPEGSTDIGVWGQHSMRGKETGYTPPCSGGGGAKIYTATIFALTVPEISIDAPAGLATRAQLKAAIYGKVIDSTYLDVTYQRGGNAPNAAAGGMGGMGGGG
jgi:phosphatidylethanolamine-binding protein (PEBP) family uncharacterized protein